MSKLPSGWKIKTLGEIATISSGGTPSRNNLEYWKDGSIPWIRTTEVQNCILNEDDTQEFITEKGLKNSSAKIVPKGTLLLAMIGQGKTRGQVAYLNFEASTNQNCATITFDCDYESKFYFQYLLSQYENIRALSNSAGQSNLSGTLVKAIKVPVPPLSEQIKIAETLSTWDNAIQATESLIANSQQQKKALMQMLLSGEKRVGGFSGEWGSVLLSDIAHITMGTSPRSSSYNSDGEGSPLIQGNADIKNRLSSPRIFTTEITKKCYIGDILLSVRAPVGSVAKSVHNACIGRGISALAVKNGNSSDFLYQWLLWFEPKWNSLSQGSTFDSINSDDIRALKLKIPCHKEQQKIAKILTTADQEIETLQQKLECLKLEKQALMQRLLN